MEFLKRFLIMSTLFCLIIISLAFAYIKLQPEVLAYRELKERASVLEIFEIPYEKKEVKLFGFIPFGKKPVEESVSEAFEKNITVTHKWKRKIFENYKNNILQGYAFSETKKGYGFNKSAPMTILIGIRPDMKTMIGLKPLDYGETPGLGGRISEEWFQKQFQGKKLFPRILWSKDLREVESNDHTFLAITGATNTTKGIAQFLNDLAGELWAEIDGELKK